MIRIWNYASLVNRLINGPGELGSYSIRFHMSDQFNNAIIWEIEKEMR